MAPITVLIADAQLLFSDALAQALDFCSEMEVLEELPVSAPETVAAVAKLKPAVALVDYWMDSMGASALAREMLRGSPETKIIFLSAFNGPNQVQEALSSGAVGFLPRGLNVNEIHDAIHRAQQGERPLYGDRLEALARRIDDRRQLVEDIHRRFMKLTPRERELLGLLGSGTAMEHLPKTMGITLATARRHVHNILHKVGARTAIEAIAMARDQGLIPGQELKLGES